MAGRIQGTDDPAHPKVEAETTELALSDADILDAMRHIPGYLDITTADFRAIYHLAHTHALERLFAGVRAGELMRPCRQPLSPEAPLDRAMRLFLDQGLKTLPVVDSAWRVLGILTETDVLRRLDSGSILELLLRLMEGGSALVRQDRETPIACMMTTPAVMVAEDADFQAIMKGFRAHSGRAMPVVDARQGRLAGMLLRKDFVAACHLGGEA